MVQTDFDVHILYLFCFVELDSNYIVLLPDSIYKSKVQFFIDNVKNRILKFSLLNQAQSPKLHGKNTKNVKIHPN